MARKIGGCTNEADGSAYEGVEVATGSVDVRLGPGAAVLLGQAAEQDGLADHYLEAQRYNIQFMAVIIEGKAGGEGSSRGKKKNLTPTILSFSRGSSERFEMILKQLQQLAVRAKTS